MTIQTAPPILDAPLLKQRFPGEVLFRVRRNPLAVLQDMAALGDVSRLRVGPLQLYMVNHPDLIREILVTRSDAFIKGKAVRLTSVVLGRGLLTSEGAFHRRQRKLVLPAFHHSRLVHYGNIMAAAAGRLNDRWTPDEPIDVEHEMLGLTLEVVGRTLFDADVTGESDELTRALTDAQIVFGKVANPFSEIILRLPLPVTRKIRQVRRRLDATIYRLIEEHRRNLPERNDLLGMLLQARDEDTGEAMSDEQVRDEAMTLFAAGHETTAIALTWTLYLLAQHQDVQARLQHELDTVLGGRLPAFDDLTALAYTRQVLSEALRLYPPAWALNRETLRDIQLGDYLIPEGVTVDMSPYVVHHDPRFWPDPERFDPDRFAPENKSSIRKFAFIPFSFGIRGCIGEQFAWTEAMLVLATLAQRWRFRRVDERPVPLRPLITLRPGRPVRLHIERRHRSD